MEKKLVIVVDMINGFCKEGALHDTDILKIVPNIIKELESVNEKDRLFIRDCHKSDSLEFNSFPLHCIEGTSESEIIDELKPFIKKESKIVKKNSTNAIWCVDLKSLVKEKYNKIYITGCCTDICVLQFALSLRTYLNQNDYDNVKIVVPSNCVHTFNAPNHSAEAYNDMAFLLMQNAGIEVS